MALRLSAGSFDLNFDRWHERAAGEPQRLVTVRIGLNLYLCTQRQRAIRIFYHRDVRKNRSERVFTPMSSRALTMVYSSHQFDHPTQREDT
jgi:hypothetical protein